MATAAGEYSGELPEPVTRSEFYWQKIAQRIDTGGSVSPESIDAAIEDYINTHDADIVTEAELSNALAGKQAVLTAGENIAIVDNNGNLTISATDTTYSAATTSTAGLMSATDKAKLDACKKIVYLASEAAYEALNPPDPDTVYLILEETT